MGAKETSQGLMNTKFQEMKFLVKEKQKPENGWAFVCAHNQDWLLVAIVCQRSLSV